MQKAERIAEFDLSSYFEELKSLKTNLEELKKKHIELETALNRDFSEDLLFQKLETEEKICKLETGIKNYSVKILFNGKQFELLKSKEQVICGKTSIVELCIPSKCKNKESSLTFLSDTEILAEICQKYYLIVLAENKLIAYRLIDKNLIKTLKDKAKYCGIAEGERQGKGEFKIFLLFISFFALAVSVAFLSAIFLYSPQKPPVEKPPQIPFKIESCPELSLEEVKNLKCPKDFKFKGIKGKFYYCKRGNLTCFYPVCIKK